MVNYKRGAFVHVLTSDPAKWEADFRNIAALPCQQHVEVWLEYIPLAKERLVLAEMLRGTEVIIHGPFIHSSLVSNLQDFAEISLRRSSEAVEFATMIGAKVITFHAGTTPVFETREIAFERLAKRFSQFVTVKSPVVTLENMPVKNGTTRECLGKLDDLRALHSIMPEVQFTLDIGHSLQNGDDFESFLREYAPRIRDIHLHDGRLGGRSHMRLGAGMLNLQKLLEVLRDLRFSRYVTLETISFADTKASWQTWLEAERISSVSTTGREAHSSD